MFGCHRGAIPRWKSLARRLRVLRGSAADPLNLIQVMLAKGCSFKRPLPHWSSCLNERHIMSASKNSFEPKSSDPLPNSTKVFVAGKIHTDVRVPFREIGLNPTKSFNDRVEINDPVRVYDTSGPWS